MGCSASSSRRGSKMTVADESRDSDEEMYLTLKRRTGLPNSFKIDGYDLGLCVKDNVNGMYSMYLGTSKKSNEKVSIKQFMISKYDPRLVTQEVANLARLSVETYPRVYELFHTETSVYMITGYLDMFRLRNYVDLRSNVTSLSMAEVRKVFKCLLAALFHAHDQHLILRCLVPDNIIVRRLEGNVSSLGSDNNSSDKKSANLEVKICDVSMGVQVTRAKTAVYSEHPLFDWSHVNYLAPEVALKLPYSFPCDIWTLGVILYMMVSARLPFAVNDPMDRALLMQKIKNSEFVFEPAELWQYIRQEIKTLIASMLVSDPLARATLPEIRRNTWVMNG